MDPSASFLLDGIPVERRLALRRRHAIGRAHFGDVLGWWFAKGKLSHRRIMAISTWIHQDRMVLSSSQISHIRNARLTNPNWVLIEGLANVNLAIHLWQTAGPRECARVYGPFGKGIDGQQILDDAIWLPHPDRDVPLEFTDWCRIFVGLLELPYVDEIIIPAGSAPHLQEELATILEGVLTHGGTRYRDGLARFMGLYPVQDPDRRDRIQRFAMGQSTLEPEDVTRELAAIAAVIEAIRDLPQGSYGPRQLWHELARDRKRT